MKVELDPEQLRASMEAWRDMVEMKVDMHPGVRSQLFEQRNKHLQSITRTAANWLTVIRACSAEGQEKIQLELLEADIQDAQKWAMAALVELKILEIEAQSGGHQ